MYRTYEYSADEEALLSQVSGLELTMELEPEPAPAARVFTRGPQVRHGASRVEEEERRSGGSVLQDDAISLNAQC